VTSDLQKGSIVPAGSLANASYVGALSTRDHPTVILLPRNFHLTYTACTMNNLRIEIERLFGLGTNVKRECGALETFTTFREALSQGEVRAAEKRNGRWEANVWVKQGILLGFRLGMAEETHAGDTFTFVDRHTYPVRHFRCRDGVRIVPGGSTVREGAYVAPGVICMPPMYINVGAYVDEGTMVDSHALVGSCAQIGKRVHLSAAAQVGGVLEPVNATPVVIEDDVLVGGNCGIYEGTQVLRRAVLGSGVILTRSTPLFDTVRGEIYRATETEPLVVPEGAVVVAGARAITKGKAAEWGLSVYTPVIVKYRDEKTDCGVELEDLLR
jgi:2,3,4,5-tetrahydropyridine-2,6-dicarboxylate N-succinyltransferase